MPKLTDFLQIAEAAEYLGVCQNTLRNWGKAGKIKEYRHPANNYRLFLKSDLDAFVGEIQPEGSKQDAATPPKKKPR
ncbi:helix-turn-helix domain-containing protein [Stieleria sp. ICT_E10.1]|uniref:helix-turn-helix domain-containing protein n=1 Tax=Stieleria sedimenti TaxID=2976331 RepID=UPI0021807A09|nr:helix-turn-helix domain-containing protein [Stieleria sedimenti]MCS7466457.1 helix-turn-helix domain-containing protein [Stieleria sedimenti]